MMNSEIALNQIGQTLMKGRDNTPLGVNMEKDMRAFHKSLQYFHLAWLEEEIKRICEQHTKKAAFCYNEYVKALRTLVNNDKEMYEQWRPASRRGYREFVIHTTPEIHIMVDGKRRKPHVRITDGGEIIVLDSDAGPYPSELVELFSDIEAKLMERTIDILFNGLKDLVPDSLKGYFLRGKFTKDMGNSMHSNGRFSIGHEIRLSATDTHDMAYAYIPDYFWDPSKMKQTFENVVYSYDAMKEISPKLPKDVEFICQHRDDCGVSLTNEILSFDDDEFYRRKAVLMVLKDMEHERSLEEGYYRHIMDYCNLSERFSLQEFLDMCNDDINKLKNYKQVINSQLGSYAEEVTVIFHTDNVGIYLMKHRERQWTRECCLYFPYHTDLSFMKDVGFFLEKAKVLNRVFENSWDIETTVGLMRSWDT